MTDTPETRNARLEDFLHALSSDEGLPGSGAAGAIALALGAACAAKAAALTLKHAPDNAPLRQAHSQLMACMDAAVEGSDTDSKRFASFLHRRSTEAADSVIAADQALVSLVDTVTALLETLDPQVRKSVAGDLVAARALNNAARIIQTENISEMRATRTR
jgi:methenyltetrahydrofolate cyclohydrolase